MREITIDNCNFRLFEFESAQEMVSWINTKMNGETNE